MTQHTPGPWALNEEAHYAEVLPYTILVPGANVGIAGVENEADARLIAAAPDLLAALELISNEIGQLNAHNEDRAMIGYETAMMIRAAIARAI